METIQERSMNQPQPGPWKVSEQCLRYGSPVFQIHWSAIGECVAEVVHGEGNARLIAAAPELLAALKYARRFVSAPDVDVAFIDAAIAKAEGNP